MHSISRHVSAPKKQQGASLVEVLVAMVVIALGLLGNVSLLAKSLKSNNTAYYRSQATLLASDVLERMRSNLPAAMAGSYNLSMGSSPSGSDFAAQDLASWKTLVTNAFPSGDASVTVDAQGNATITLRWTDTSKLDAKGAVVNSNFSTQSVL